MPPAVRHRRSINPTVLSSGRPLCEAFSFSLALPSLPRGARFGKWVKGESMGKPVAVVICMPERLGLCTYTEGPEQSLRGEKEGIRGGCLVSCSCSC